MKKLLEAIGPYNKAFVGGASVAVTEFATTVADLGRDWIAAVVVAVLAVYVTPNVPKDTTPSGD